MATILGNALPNIPWQDPPAVTRTPLWRYDGNPIIGRDGNKRSNSVFNSAVVPFGDGFAGVFRCDSLSISMDIFAGFSKDGIHWTIDDEPIHLVGEDTEITRREYRYDPRVLHGRQILRDLVQRLPRPDDRPGLHDGGPRAGLHQSPFVLRIFPGKRPARPPARCAPT